MKTSNRSAVSWPCFRPRRIIYGSPRLTLAALTVALVAGLVTLTGPTAAAADSRAAARASTSNTGENGARDGSVSYSTGKTGHKLKWLPHRPSKAAPASEARRLVTKERLAQHTSPVAATPTPRRAADPFDDPFEDRKRTPEPRPPKAIFGEDAPEDAGLQPLMTGSLPEMRAEGPPVDSETAEPAGETSGLGPDEKLRVTRIDPKTLCGLAEFKPISEITCDISVKGEKPYECPLPAGELPDRQTKGWAPATFTWKASALCHKPAYFEDVHLERYGHSWGPYLQPVISGGHFFLTVPIVPYKMGLYPPNECMYTLGYYRPGSCAPYMLDPVPLSVRAALAEAGVWTGMAYLIP